MVGAVEAQAATRQIPDQHDFVSQRRMPDASNRFYLNAIVGPQVLLPTGQKLL
jgi:hypothetical protein